MPHGTYLEGLSGQSFCGLDFFVSFPTRILVQPMTLLSMQSNAVTTSYVAQRGVFRECPFRLVDVGARGGYDEVWDVFQDQLAVIGFEPEPSECARLNANAPPNVKYLPFALGAREETREFLIAAFSGSSGLCGGDTEFIRRFFEGDNQRTVEKELIQVHPLDRVLQEYGIQSVDFLKLDCEGADLEVLFGAEKTLAELSTLGVLVEVWFQKESRECGYTFFDIHEYLSSKGFMLFDVDAYRYNRKAMPYPFLSDIRDENGRLVAGQTTHGQIIRGDALYLRDFVGLQSEAGANFSSTQILKLVCLYELFGLNDCAAEVVLRWKDQLSPIVSADDLLNLLTPPLKGRKLNYHDYVRYAEAKPLSLRPSLRSMQDIMKRTAEVVLRFDGRLSEILLHVFRRVRRAMTGT
jgi:FkbM family methyltransferase